FWLDDVKVLLARSPVAAPGKGMAFILGNDEGGPAVLVELARRYPNHKLVGLHVPQKEGWVFAKALLVPPEGRPALATTTGGVAEEVPERIEEAPPTPEPPGKLRGPRGVAVTRDGDIAVCDFGNNRIQEFGGDFAFLRQWGARGPGHAEFRDPCGIAAGP